MEKPKIKKKTGKKKEKPFLVTASLDDDNSLLLQMHFVEGTSVVEEMSMLSTLQLAIIKEVKKRIRLFNAHCEHKKD